MTTSGDVVAGPLTKKWMRRGQSELLDWTMSVAEQASRLLARPELGRIKRQSRRDAVVAADDELDVELARLLAPSGWPVISESHPPKSISSRRTHWIIDPLDGSVNYARGLPLYCVSIALWDGMEPRLGVVFNPVTKEMFAGEVGKGCWRNSAPVAVSPIMERKRAILATGLPAARRQTRANLHDFVDFGRQFMKVRYLGSAALSLAYVSSGVVDVYSEDRVRLWDVAAGLALVAAAGGVVRVKHLPGLKCDVLAGTPQCVEGPRQ